MSFKYVYGPVPSRRLGRSIGVSPIPSKTCNYSCIYCQLGKTTRMTNTRREFFPVEEILRLSPVNRDEIWKNRAKLVIIGTCKKHIS